MLKIAITGTILLILVLDNSLPTFNLPVLLAMACGFVVKTCSDWADNSISFKKSTIQLVYAICLTWIGLVIWKDFDIKWNIIYYVAISSCFSIYIISEIKRAFTLGFKNWLQKWINNIIAKQDDRV